jgi:hypothetical protein
MTGFRIPVAAAGCEAQLVKHFLAGQKHSELKLAWLSCNGF